MQQSRVSREIQWLLKEKHHGRLTPSAKKDIARLQKGEYVDYIIGFVEFLDCKIDLSSKPFIPRPETEYWVGRAIQDIRTAPFPIKCLDLFAGSGCIGVAILEYIPQAVVDFGEEQKRLLPQIRLNVKKNGIEKKRYRVLHSDIFSGIKRKYDYIFANPPYIAESRKSKVQKSVLMHEPREALFAGKDGLDIIRLFLNQVKEFLNPRGRVYLEFDSFQRRAIEQYLKKIGYQSWQFHKDQYGNWRFAAISP